jgi:hypothetical protein
LLIAGEPSADPLSEALNAFCSHADVGFAGSTIVARGATNGRARTVAFDVAETPGSALSTLNNL